MLSSFDAKNLAQLCNQKFFPRTNLTIDLKGAIEVTGIYPESECSTVKLSSSVTDVVQVPRI